jgi:FkbM family methyltransferase
MKMKTQILNFLRQLFFWAPLENFLIRRSVNKPLNSFWTKIPPNHYQYEKPTYRLATRNGINYNLDLNDIVDWTVYYGIIEPARITLYKNISPSDIIIDIGGNMGETAMNFGKIVAEKGFVFSFEPDPKNYMRFSYNLSLNNFQNITLINKGIGNSIGSFTLLNTKGNNAGMNKIISHDMLIKDSTETVQIEVITLDSFIQNNHIKMVNLIKIDVEGFEYNVLKGGEECLKKFMPKLFIELDNNLLIEQESSANELITFLELLGYNIFKASNMKPLNSTDKFNNCHFDIFCEK